MRATSRSKAGYSVSAICAGKLCWTCCQCDWKRYILSVLTLDKRAVWGMSLMFRPFHIKNKHSKHRFLAVENIHITYKLSPWSEADTELVWTVLQPYKRFLKSQHSFPWCFSIADCIKAFDCLMDIHIQMKKSTHSALNIISPFKKVIL